MRVMHDPISELMDEHRIIEKVLTALEAAADRDMPLDFYERAADFIANFADGCHHAKEEDRLFPVLEQRGIPRQEGPIGVMCDEHEIGRALVKRMRDAVAAGDAASARAASVDYAALLRAHIMKEDQILFPMGRGQLSQADLEALSASFQEVETARLHERWAHVGDDLLRAAGL
ncbi:MAG: hemerythrin domain-containing protein [Planctomycetota bacterium]|jgi:hemerythrin-like domain-containing protein